MPAKFYHRSGDTGLNRCSLLAMSWQHALIPLLYICNVFSV